MTRLLGPDPTTRTAAPPGMREQVMRAGLRRRRFAFAGAGSAAAVAVVAAAGIFAGTTAGSDSLRIDQPATGPSAHSSAVAVSESTDVGTTAGTSSVTAPRPDGPTTQPRPAAAPAPSGRPSASPRSEHGTHGPVTRKDREFGQVCQGDQWLVGTGGAKTSDWCVMVTPPESREATSQPTLTFTICRSTTKDSGALTYDTAQEVEFVVSVPATDKKMWTWSTGQRFPRTRHVLHRGSSQCFDWQTSWDWRDDRGAAIPAHGSLRLTAWSTSVELRRSPVSVDFSS
jgi:hypothetical protein